MSRTQSPIYGLDGRFLGTDDQGFKGELIFMNEANFYVLGGYNNGTDGSKKGGITHETALFYGTTFDKIVRDNGISQGNSDMINNAITHVVSQVKDSNFKVSELTGGKTSTYFTMADTSTNDGFDFITSYSNGGTPPVLNGQNNPAHTGVKERRITYNLTSGLWSGKGQFTVANIQNAAFHEGGHLNGGITGEGKGHAKAYQIQMKHYTWRETTKEWKNKIIEGMNNILKR